MSFELNDEQRMMVETARRVVREVIVEPRKDMEFDQSGEFPHAIYRTLWENGLVNLEFPESVGGAGLSCTDHCIIGEEIQYGCLGIGTSVAANSLAAMPLMLADNAALTKKYLGALTEEPIYAAYGCSEPDAGSDVASMTTKYRKKGDTYVITGQKRWITNGDVAKWWTVFAREEGSQGHKGIACFVVDADAPGAKWDSVVHKMGQRTRSQVWLAR
ncbi:MAG: acyl-CoA dehydrogenase family protein, partial [Myxococcota bacterium]